MAFIVDTVEQYAADHTTPTRSAARRAGGRDAGDLSIPEMLSGAVVGRLLELLVHTSGARRVLEIGTYSGYSALSMAAGLPADGRIDTCEIDEAHAEVARRYIARSPYADRITVHLGPALDTIAGLEGTFDFVFIDADKTGYLDYYEAVVPRLSDRGVIAADNTLRSGTVVEDDGSAGIEGDSGLQRPRRHRSARDVRPVDGARRGDADPPPLTARRSGNDGGFQVVPAADR